MKKKLIVSKFPNLFFSSAAITWIFIATKRPHAYSWFHTSGLHARQSVSILDGIEAANILGEIVTWSPFRITRQSIKMSVFGKDYDIPFKYYDNEPKSYYIVQDVMSGMLWSINKILLTI